MNAAQILTSIRGCDAAEFSEKWNDWITSLISTVKRDPANNTAWFGLSALVQEAQPFPSISRELSLTHISPLCSEICKQKDVTRSQLYCLAKCIQLFPGACGSQRPKLATFITESLAKPDAQVTEIASLCFAYSSLLTAGQGPNRQAEQWGQMLQLVQNSILIILNSFDSEIERPTGDSISFPDEPEDLGVVCGRVETLFLCMRHLLNMQGGSRMLPIGQCASLVQQSLVKGVRDHLNLVTINNAALKFVPQLLESSGVQIVPVARALTLSICVHFDWATANIGSSDCLDALKSHSYKALALLTDRCGIGSNIHVVCERLWKGIEQDVRLESREQCQPLAFVGRKSKKHKKKKQAALDHQSANKATDLFIPKSPSRDRLAHAACCEFLSKLFLAVGSFLKPGFLTQVQRIVCLEALAGVQEPENLSQVNHLLEALRSLLLVQHPNVSPPVQIASRIFTLAQLSTRDCVRFSGAEGLAVCRSLTRPRVPALETVQSNASIEMPPEQTQTNRMSSVSPQPDDYGVIEQLENQEQTIRTDPISEARSDAPTRLVTIDSSTNSSSSDSEEEEVAILQPEFKKPRVELSTPQMPTKSASKKTITNSNHHYVEPEPLGSVEQMLLDFVE